MHYHNQDPDPSSQLSVLKILAELWPLLLNSSHIFMYSLELMVIMKVEGLSSISPLKKRLKLTTEANRILINFQIILFSFVSVSVLSLTTERKYETVICQHITV